MPHVFPQDRYYDRRDHLWVLPEADGTRMRVGIDALGLESLGDLAYIALPLVGSTIERGKASGTLEAAKMTGEIIAPVSGKIVARNDPVLRDPSLVNRDNYQAGWLFTIEPSQWQTESASLVRGADIAAWADSEIARYRELGWIHAV